MSKTRRKSSRRTLAGTSESVSTVTIRETWAVIGSNAVGAALDTLAEEGLVIGDKLARLARKAGADKAAKDGFPVAVQWLDAKDREADAADAEAARVFAENLAEIKRLERTMDVRERAAREHAAEMERIYKDHLAEKTAEIRRLANIIRAVRGVAKEEEVT